MYRCSLCRASSNPQQPLKRHILYRADGTILKEMPVCGSCYSALRDGVTLAELSAKCDLCGQKAVGGQLTAATILCAEHAHKARQASLYITPDHSH